MRIIIFLFCLVVLGTTVSAQDYNFIGNTEPIETTFTQDSILFSELLSEFQIRCQQYDSLPQGRWHGRVLDRNMVPLDTKYEKILVSVPLFKAYPAFRIDCTNGYVLGIYNCYENKESIFAYCDILSYDRKGRMVSRLSISDYILATYEIDDSKMVLGVVGHFDIMNGKIHSSVNKYDSTSGYSGSYSIYKIQDDATFKLLSVENLQ